MCSGVWDTPSVEVPKPSLNPKQRVRSWSNLLDRSSRSNDDFLLTPDKEEDSLRIKLLDQE